MIYFIRARGTRFVKIGYTAEPKRKPNGKFGKLTRLHGLQHASPYRLVLESLLIGTLEDERATHLHFAAQRVRGEWFALSRKEVRAFCTQYAAPECAITLVSRSLSSGAHDARLTQHTVAHTAAPVTPVVLLGAPPVRQTGGVKVSFTLSEATAQILDEISRRTGASKSSVVAFAVRAHAERLGLVAPKKNMQVS